MFPENQMFIKTPFLYCQFYMQWVDYIPNNYMQEICIFCSFSLQHSIQDSIEAKWNKNPDLLLKQSFIFSKLFLVFPLILYSIAERWKQHL